jgi:hypothetical protein
VEEINCKGTSLENLIMEITAPDSQAKTGEYRLFKTSFLVFVIWRCLFISLKLKSRLNMKTKRPQSSLPSQPDLLHLLLYNIVPFCKIPSQDGESKWTSIPT